MDEEAKRVFNDHPETLKYRFLPGAIIHIMHKRYAMAEIKKGFRHPSHAASYGLDYPENPDQLKYPENFEILYRLQREEDEREAANRPPLNPNDWKIISGKEPDKEILREKELEEILLKKAELEKILTDLCTERVGLEYRIYSTKTRIEILNSSAQKRISAKE